MLETHLPDDRLDGRAIFLEKLRKFVPRLPAAVGPRDLVNAVAEKVELGLLRKPESGLRDIPGRASTPMTGPPLRRLFRSP